MATSKEFNSEVHTKCMIPNPAISRLKTWNYKSGNVESPT